MFGDSKDTPTLSHYIEATRRFRERPPVATRIYFVDRTREYYRVVFVIGEAEPKQQAVMITPMWGVPLFIVNSKNYTPDLPECCKTPGIWVIMSDGAHKRLDGDESRET